MATSTRTRTIPTALRLLVLACGLAVSSAAADSGVWFDDLKEPPSLSDDDLRQLGNLVWQKLTDEAAAEQSWPATWKQDRAARIVFVSISDGINRADVGFGAEHGLAAAVTAALDAARAKRKATAAIRWVRVDLVHDVLMQWIQPDAAPGSAWHHNRTGLASDRSVRLALLASELVANGLLDSSGRVLPSEVAKYALQHTRRSEAAQLRPWDNGAVYRFTTIGLIHDRTGTVPLIRGRRRFDPVRISDLATAVRFAGRYLTDAVDDNGRFTYIYQPDTDLEPAKYNILRHAGSVYAMLEAYELTRDPATLAAIKRALGYLQSTVMPTTILGQNLHGVVERRYIKLGGNALAVLALSKYITVTGDRTDLDLARRLAELIVAVQGPTGRFLIHKAHQRTGRSTGFVSQYYPGEAVFALMNLYAIDPDPRWLDAAAGAADYLGNVRDRRATIKSQIHDHWLLYGLDLLYRQRPKPAYLEHTRRIVAAMRATQHQSDPEDDWHGGYYLPARSTPTSTRVEGLLAAVRLLGDFGTPEETAQTRQAAQRGAVFVLKRQFMPEAAIYFTRPKRCLNGVRMDLINPEIRIDYVQHAISCWLAMAKLMASDER